MKTLCYGSLNIDLVFSVDHIAHPGETISSGAMIKSSGGKGANQAAALAKAGMEVYMAGKIGEDGEFLLKLLESYGVCTEKIIRYEGPSGQAIIQVDKNGQNSIILFAGGNGLVSTGEIDHVLSIFEKNDLIVLQNEIANTDYIMKKAKDHGLRIALNPSPWNKTAEALPLELADIFFVNEIEGACLARLEPTDSFEKIVDSLCLRFPASEIILTAGSEGAFYGCGETRARGEALNVRAVDTTGAGDCFTGYFLASRNRGLSVQDSLNMACRAAAIAISREGAMESIPFRDEVFGL